MPIRYDDPVQFEGRGTPEHDAWESRREARAAAAQADHREAAAVAKKALMDELPNIKKMDVQLMLGVNGRKSRARVVGAIQHLTREVSLEARTRAGDSGIVDGVDFHLRYMKHRCGGLCNLEYKIASPEMKFSATIATRKEDSKKLSQMAKDWLMSL